MYSNIVPSHTALVSVVNEPREIRLPPAAASYAACEEKLVDLLSSNFCGFDTSSLMLLSDENNPSDSYCQIRFLSMLESVCVQLNRPIFTSMAVWYELIRLSEHTSDRICIAARRALDLLRRLDSMDLVMFHEAIGKSNSADREMLLLIMMLRPAMPNDSLLIFTQDLDLSEALLRHNHDNMIPGKELSVYRIAHSGEPLGFYENKS